MNAEPTNWHSKLIEWVRDHTTWRYTGDKFLDWLEKRWKEPLGAALGATAAAAWAYAKTLSPMQILAIALFIFFAILILWDMLAIRGLSKAAQTASPASHAAHPVNPPPTALQLGPQPVPKPPPIPVNDVEEGHLRFVGEEELEQSVNFRRPFEWPPHVSLQYGTAAGFRQVEIEKVTKYGFTLRVKLRFADATLSWRAEGQRLPITHA